VSLHGLCTDQIKTLTRGLRFVVMSRRSWGKINVDVYSAWFFLDCASMKYVICNAVSLKVFCYVSGVIYRWRYEYSFSGTPVSYKGVLEIRQQTLWCWELHFEVDVGYVWHLYSRQYVRPLRSCHWQLRICSTLTPRLAERSGINQCLRL